MRALTCSPHLLNDSIIAGACASLLILLVLNNIINPFPLTNMYKGEAYEVNVHDNNEYRISLKRQSQRAPVTGDDVITWLF